MSRTLKNAAVFATERAEAAENVVEAVRVDLAEFGQNNFRTVRAMAVHDKAINEIP